jgi:hypothetical protein
MRRNIASIRSSEKFEKLQEVKTKAEKCASLSTDGDLLLNKVIKLDFGIEFLSDVFKN